MTARSHYTGFTLGAARSRYTGCSFSAARSASSGCPIQSTRFLFSGSTTKAARSHYTRIAQLLSTRSLLFVAGSSQRHCLSLIRAQISQEIHRESSSLLLWVSIRLSYSGFCIAGTLY